MNSTHPNFFQKWKNNLPDTRNESYDAYTYKDDLSEIYDKHDPSTIHYSSLYLQLHKIHDPMEAPEEWLNLYTANSTCEKRRTIQAMVSLADNATGHVVELLKKKDLWDNTMCQLQWW